MNHRYCSTFNTSLSSYSQATKTSPRIPQFSYPTRAEGGRKRLKNLDPHTTSKWKGICWGTKLRPIWLLESLLAVQLNYSKKGVHDFSEGVI